jgi:hypothetical protein
MIDFIGELRRMMNKNAAETFNPLTDSLEAIADALGIGPSVGLSMFGICDPAMVGSTTTIVTTNLSGLVDDIFNDEFYVQVILNANAPGTAPEGEIRRITNFVAATQTFTTDAFSANVEANDLILILHETLISIEIVARGTFTLSDLINPEDNTRTEGNNYFKGCLLMPTEGAARFQPRLITSYTGVGGVFSLDQGNPFSVLPGLVDYIIIRNQTPFVPTVDGAETRLPADVIGNKADTPVYALGNFSSLMRYIKGLNHIKIVATGDADAGSDFDTLVDAARTEANNYWDGHTLRMLTGNNAGLSRPIVNYMLGVGIEVAPPFPNAIGVGDGYAILSDYNAAIERTLDGVYVDDINGVAGTTWPIGTPGMPVSNLADAFTIAVARNLKVIHLSGSFVLSDNIPDMYTFVGESSGSADIDFNNHDAAASNFKNLYLTGIATGGSIWVEDCYCENLTADIGFGRNCVFTGSVTIMAASIISFCQFVGCQLTVPEDAVYLTDISGGLVLLQSGASVSVYVYGNALHFEIDVSCTGGSVDIDGDVYVIDSSGGATINDYSTPTRIGRQLLCMDFWSDSQEELAILQAAGTKALPDVTVADLPAGATIVRAIAIFKCRMIENTNGAANKLDGATVAATSQVIQVRDDTPGTWRDAINFVDDQFGLAATTREGGDVCMGSVDIAVEVDGNDTYNFQWLLAKADQDNLNFNDVQVGLRIWYSV